jgi:hypothetical protein
MLRTLSSRLLIAMAALGLAAGCSGGSLPTAPGGTSAASAASHALPAGAHWIRGSDVEGRYMVPSVPQRWNLPHAWPAMKKQVLFVADPQNSQVLMYNPKTPNPSPEGSITNGIDYPFGLAVDKHGTLYVANLLGGVSYSGSIAIYPAGSSSPSQVITTGLAAPYGIGVDSKGNIFAANLNNDTIVGYKAGASSPYETINFSSYGQALGVGVDGKDNVWVASDSTNQVYEIPAGSSTPQNAGLSGLNGSINIAFGKKDVFYVSNFGGSNVTCYKYGTTSPFMTITNGIEHYGPTLSGFTKSDYYFQSNQFGNVSGYKKGKSAPFSTITGIPDPRGIASTPLVKR